MMTRSLLRSLPALLLATGFLVPGRARAEAGVGPQRCDVRILPEGGTAPISLPAFVIENQSSNGLTAAVTTHQPADASAGLQLTQIDDPWLTGTRLLVPSNREVLEVGRPYEIPYAVSCSGFPGSPQTSVATFTATAAVPLPTTIGTVTGGADGKTYVALSTELDAYLRTASFEVFVDGTSAGKTGYGHTREAGNLRVQLDRYGVLVGGVRTGAPLVCPEGASTGEEHQARLVAHVAGAETDPEPLTFALSADCTEPARPVVVAPPGDGPDSDSDTDQGALAKDDGGGCAVAASGSAASGLAVTFGLGAVVSLLGLRRRGRTQTRGGKRA